MSPTDRIVPTDPEPTASPRTHSTTKPIAATVATLLVLLALIGSVFAAGSIFTTEDAAPEAPKTEQAASAPAPSKQTGTKQEAASSTKKADEATQDDKADDKAAASSKDKGDEQADEKDKDTAGDTSAKKAEKKAASEKKKTSSKTTSSTTKTKPASTTTPSSTKEDATPSEPAKPEPKTIKVSIKVDASAADDDLDFKNTFYNGSVTLAEDASVYDALKATGLSLKGDSTYVKAISGLGEKMDGAKSGWMYSVNGTVPMKACGKYTLSDGDKVRWYYVTGD